MPPERRLWPLPPTNDPPRCASNAGRTRAPWQDPDLGPCEGRRGRVALDPRDCDTAPARRGSAGRRFCDDLEFPGDSSRARGSMDCPSEGPPLPGRRGQEGVRCGDRHMGVSSRGSLFVTVTYIALAVLAYATPRMPAGDRVALAAVHAYRATLSRLTPACPARSGRSCSDRALDAVREHGARGLLLVRAEGCR
jgi:hypothetical protein